MRMAEKNQTELFSALTGERGQEALQMLQRMERLKKLMGTSRPAELHVPKKKEEMQDIFCCSKNENMILAAIPFLDQEYQKEIYVLVRLMEMRRVLQGELLESREKTAESAAVRRRTLLETIQPFLPEKEKVQLQNCIRLMDMKVIMEQGDTK